MSPLHRLSSLLIGLLMGALWFGLCYFLALSTFGGDVLRHVLERDEIYQYSRVATFVTGTAGFLFALGRRSRDSAAGMGRPHSWDGFLLGLPLFSLACLAAAFDPRPAELQEL